MNYKDILLHSKHKTLFQKDDFCKYTLYKDKFTTLRNWQPWNTNFKIHDFIEVKLDELLQEQIHLERDWTSNPQAFIPSLAFC